MRGACRLRARSSTCHPGRAILGVAAILSLACDHVEPSAPTTSSIRVLVSHVGEQIDLDLSGYTVTLDDGPARALSFGRDLIIKDVGPGGHLIRLGDLDPNCSVSGSNPRSVDVTAQAGASSTVAVAFVVSCAPKNGTIRVSATTVGEDQDGDGYTVEIGGEGKGRVQANGTISVEGVREGEWGVTLGNVSANCKVDGPSTANVNVAFGATTNVAFSVRCVPAGSLIVTSVVTGVDFYLGGYQLSVSLTDGSFATSVRVPTNGSLTIPGLLPGDYRLTLTSVFPNCVPAPTVPRTAVVVTGTSTAVTLAIACEGPRRIVFVGGSGKDADIYVIYSNGTGATRLTSTPGADLDPAWSPDGNKIVFSSERDGNFEIYSMSVGGGNPVRLTQNVQSDSRPAWSPDGSRIAFVSDRDGNSEIYVMNADGTNQERLTNHEARDFDPDWSPDGTRIAFSSYRPPAGIWIMNADGSGQRRLTTNIFGDHQPAWSPDGLRIAFSRGISPNRRDIYFVNTDGSNEVPFTIGRELAADPSWSPDGRNLAFATLECYSGYYYYYDYDYCDYHLETRSADGARYLPLGTSTAGSSNPRYQP